MAKDICAATGGESESRVKPAIGAGLIMETGGWRTRNVLEPYVIVLQTDIADALKNLEISQSLARCRSFTLLGRHASGNRHNTLLLLPSSQCERFP